MILKELLSRLNSELGKFQYESNDFALMHKIIKMFSDDEIENGIGLLKKNQLILCDPPRQLLISLNFNRKRTIDVGEHSKLFKFK